ncbi:MAG: lysophospholipid acyltransferase family protein [Bacteroidota bacterium]
MFFLRLISHLPLPVLYLFSDFLFFGSFYVVRYRRKMVQKNLRNAFPEKSPAELSLIEKGFFKNLCDYAVETLKLLTISRAELLRRMVLKNMDLPAGIARQNRSFVVLASHQFNWEWLLVSASADYPVPLDFVYQSVNSKFFEDVSQACRTRFGAFPIKRDEVGREMVKRRNLARAICTVADQYPGYTQDKKYFTQFLNQETVFFYGTNQLAILSQGPVIYYKMKRIKRGYYEAYPEIVATPPYEKNKDVVIENYVRVVEEMIRENPSGWLWSHNRWKKRHLEQA